MKRDWIKLSLAVATILTIGTASKAEAISFNFSPIQPLNCHAYMNLTRPCSTVWGLETGSFTGSVVDSSTFFPSNNGGQGFLLSSRFIVGGEEFRLAPLSYLARSASGFTIQVSGTGNMFGVGPYVTIRFSCNTGFDGSVQCNQPGSFYARSIGATPIGNGAIAISNFVWDTPVASTPTPTPPTVTPIIPPPPTSPSSPIPTSTPGQPILASVPEPSSMGALLLLSAYWLNHRFKQKLLAQKSTEL